MINLKEIVNAQIVKLPNETAQYIKNEKDRQCYIYDYYLQLNCKAKTTDSLNRLLKRDKKKAMLIKYTKTKSMMDESVPLVQHNSAKPPAT